jgi:hypothetical protein
VAAASVVDLIRELCRTGRNDLGVDSFSLFVLSSNEPGLRLYSVLAFASSVPGHITSFRKDRVHGCFDAAVIVVNGAAPQLTPVFRAQRFSIWTAPLEGDELAGLAGAVPT